MNIEKAIRLLDRELSISLKQISSLWETDPVGYEDQPPFFNAVILIKVKKLSLIEIHSITKGIEGALGKNTHFCNGPRAIDLDLLFATGCASHTDELTIPHPRIQERLFVLLPLEEIIRSFPQDREELFGKVDIYDKIGSLQKSSNQKATIYAHQKSEWWI